MQALSFGITFSATAAVVGGSADFGVAYGRFAYPFQWKHVSAIKTNNSLCSCSGPGGEFGCYETYCATFSLKGMGCVCVCVRVCVRGVCACVRACVRARVRVCVCVCVFEFWHLACFEIARPGAQQ